MWLAEELTASQRSAVTVNLFLYFCGLRLPRRPRLSSAPSITSKSFAVLHPGGSGSERMHFTVRNDPHLRRAGDVVEPSGDKPGRGTESMMLEGVEGEAIRR